MNTNSNVYTVIYTTIVVILVAALLAFVAAKLGPSQEANEKAETVSQVLTAAQFGDKEHWQQIGNAATLAFFAENVLDNAPVVSVAELKALIISNMTARGGLVESLESRNGSEHVKAQAALAKMFGYSTTLRSLTQGRGTFSLSFSHFAEA